MEKLFTFANRVFHNFDQSHDIIHGWKTYYLGAKVVIQMLALGDFGLIKLYLGLL